ncbi:hypothetical protein ADUPG1_004952, partial [Aduncisulcus paluster]
MKTDIQKIPRLFGFGKPLFRRFVKEFQKYPRSIYEDVVDTTLPDPVSLLTEDESGVPEIRSSEEEFIKAVKNHFGQLSGLDALYEFRKISLREITMTAVSKYLTRYRETLED